MPLDFSTPENTVNTVESLRHNALSILYERSLTEAGRQLVFECIQDYLAIKLRWSEFGKKNRKWNSMKEKNDFYNAKRRGKVKA